jgi:hypothetical protein
MIQFAPEPSGRAAFDAFWRSLLVADWEDAQGSLRLNPNLALADLAPASFFQNTRLLLTALADANGAAATASGNLNRVFVRQVFDRRTASEWPGISAEDSIRVTALWRKFISFGKSAQFPRAAHGA